MVPRTKVAIIGTASTARITIGTERCWSRCAFLRCRQLLPTQVDDVIPCDASRACVWKRAGDASRAWCPLRLAGGHSGKAKREVDGVRREEVHGDLPRHVVWKEDKRAVAEGCAKGLLPLAHLRPAQCYRTMFVRCMHQQQDGLRLGRAVAEFSHAPMRWGTYACPQCLPSDIVPIRSWTWTLRRPATLYRLRPCHAIPSRMGTVWYGLPLETAEIRSRLSLSLFNLHSNNTA